MWHVIGGMWCHVACDQWNVDYVARDWCNVMSYGMRLVEYGVMWQVIGGIWCYVTCAKWNVVSCGM